MQKRALGGSGLEIAPLVFGANVLGWTIDEPTSFRVLDAFVDHGFDAIDTADVYSAWKDGHQGGESETILGNWFAANPGKRDKVVLFTKVGSPMPGGRGLAADWIVRAAEDSLRRLRTDRIDLYFSHRPDADTPHEQTLGAYAQLIAAGKVSAIGASNYTAEQLAAALHAAQANSLPHYQVLQPEYNLYDRDSFEGPLQELCQRENIGVVPYYGLAAGFLSGKYRGESDLDKSPRGATVGKRYLNDRGQAVLSALDDVAARHGAAPADVALAWLMARPGITAPIASATDPAHVRSFAAAARLHLSPDDHRRLNDLDGAVPLS